MTSALPFSEEHRDCLQEICNVAMGAAGESLANFTKLFVNLSIPKIRYIKPKDIREAISCLKTEEKISSAVQFFSMDEHGGYALVIISEPSFNDLAQAAKYKMETDADARRLLEDLTHTINNTCLPNLAHLMDAELETYHPDILSLHVPIDEFCLNDIAGWDHVVSIEINYHLENHPFNCDLLLLLPDVVIDELTEALEKLIND